MLLGGFFASQFVEGQRWRSEEKMLSQTQVFPADQQLHTGLWTLAAHKHLNCELTVLFVFFFFIFPSISVLQMQDQIMQLVDHFPTSLQSVYSKKVH